MSDSSNPAESMRGTTESAGESSQASADDLEPHRTAAQEILAGLDEVRDSLASLDHPPGTVT